MNFRNKKRLQVINYVFQKLGRDEENKEFLIKLVYLADKFFLLRYGSTITCDRFVAFERGPVSAQTLAILDRNEEHIEDNENTVVEEFVLLWYICSNSAFRLSRVFCSDSISARAESYLRIDTHPPAMTDIVQSISNLVVVFIRNGTFLYGENTKS